MHLSYGAKQSPDNKVGQRMNARLQSLVKKYLSMSLGIRLALGGLSAAIGGSTIMGFLAEYGAVNYALAYGARLPTEGVPYLRYAVTGIGLSMILIVAAVFLVFNWLLRVSLKQFTNSPEFGLEKSPTQMALTQYIMRGVLPAFAATQAIVMLFYTVVPVSPTQQWGGILLIFFLTGIIMILGRKPRWTTGLLTCIFLGCMGAFIVATFTPSLYGKALLFARQGGNLPINLKINCKDVSPCDADVAGELFLRTTDYYLLRNVATQTMREIPVQSVQGVSYAGEERWGTR